VGHLRRLHHGVFSDPRNKSRDNCRGRPPEYGKNSWRGPVRRRSASPAEVARSPARPAMVSVCRLVRPLGRTAKAFCLYASLSVSPCPPHVRDTASIRRSIGHASQNALSSSDGDRLRSASCPFLTVPLPCASIDEREQFRSLVPPEGGLCHVQARPKQRGGVLDLLQALDRGAYCLLRFGSLCERRSRWAGA